MMENKVIAIRTGEFDVTRYPLIRYTANKLDPTVEDVEDYHKVMIEIMENTEGKFIFLVDGTTATWLSSDARIAMGKKQKEREASYPNRVHQAYIVVPNAIVRMMLKGINLVSKSQADQFVFSNLEEAESAIDNELKNWKR